jgi:adenylosuccinate synthase
VPLRHSVRVNSVSSIVLNKLDILSGLDEVKVCVGYQLNGELIEEWPMSASVLERATPRYETFEGWREDIRECRSVEELPAAARRYVAAIEQRAGVPISHISVGPERTQTIIASEVAAAALTSTGTPVAAQ